MNGWEHRPLAGWARTVGVALALGLAGAGCAEDDQSGAQSAASESAQSSQSGETIRTSGLAHTTETAGPLSIEPLTITLTDHAEEANGH